MRKRKSTSEQIFVLLTFYKNWHSVFSGTLIPTNDGQMRSVKRVFLCLHYGQVSGSGNTRVLFVRRMRAPGHHKLVVNFLNQSNEAYNETNIFSNFLYRICNFFYLRRCVGAFRSIFRNATSISAGAARLSCRGKEKFGKDPKSFRQVIIQKIKSIMLEASRFWQQVSYIQNSNKGVLNGLV